MTEKQTNIHIAYCWRCDWSGSVTNGENICPSCQTLSLRHKSRHKIYCATQNERRIESQREINGPCNCMTIAEPYEDQKRKQPPEQEQPR